MSCQQCGYDEKDYVKGKPCPFCGYTRGRPKEVKNMGRERLRAMFRSVKVEDTGFFKNIRV